MKKTKANPEASRVDMSTADAKAVQRMFVDVWNAFQAVYSDWLVLRYHNPSIDSHDSVEVEEAAKAWATLEEKMVAIAHTTAVAVGTLSTIKKTPPDRIRKSVPHVSVLQEVAFRLQQQLPRAKGCEYQAIDDLLAESGFQISIMEWRKTGKNSGDLAEVIAENPSLETSDAVGPIVTAIALLVRQIQTVKRRVKELGVTNG